MKRIKVALGELKPNPFRKEVNGGKLFSESLEQIQESADKTSFWEHWVVREKDGEYQLAWGHHRLQMAIEKFGKKYEVSVQVETYTDAQMLQSMALDNAKNGSRATAVRDTLLAAQKFLAENPEQCKATLLGSSPSKQATKGCAAGQHGNSECISNFLGPKNYPSQTIREYTGIADDVIGHVATKGATHPERQDKIPLKAAVAISQLPTKEVRQAAVAAVREANKGYNEPIITASEVKRIVTVAKSAPVPQQKKIIQQEVKKQAAARKVTYFKPPKVSVDDIDSDFLKKFMDELRRSKQYPRQQVKFDQVPDSVIKTASEVIDAGLRALALKKHPDHGGKQEDMQALNAAVAWLRLIVEKERTK